MVVVPAAISGPTVVPVNAAPVNGPVGTVHPQTDLSGPTAGMNATTAEVNDRGAAAPGAHGGNGPCGKEAPMIAPIATDMKVQAKHDLRRVAQGLPVQSPSASHRHVGNAAGSRVRSQQATG